MAGPVLDALVAGAGPAGSAAARALALAGARVLLCDARSLPRHRLCGEFVSPEAEADIRALGLDWTASGARAAGKGPKLRSGHRNIARKPVSTRSSSQP